MRRALLVLGVLGTGCGRIGFSVLGDDAGGDGSSDGGLAFGDPNGYWRVDQVREADTSQLFVRDDPEFGVRGNATILVPSLKRREMRILNAVAQAPSTQMGSLTVEDDLWTIVEDAITSTYRASWITADKVDLTLDRAAGTVGEPAYDFVRLERVSPPSPDLFGTKQLLRTAFAGMPEVAAGECQTPPLGGGRRTTAALTMDEHLLFHTESEVTTYPNADCSGAPVLQNDNATMVYYELEGDQFHWWGDFTQSGALEVSGTLTLTATEIRSVSDFCRPQSSCEQITATQIFSR